MGLAEVVSIFVREHNGRRISTAASAVEMILPLRAAGDNLLIVSSDQRLVTAARSEGLTAFNPETQSAADLDAVLGP